MPIVCPKENGISWVRKGWEDEQYPLATIASKSAPQATAEYPTIVGRKITSVTLEKYPLALAAPSISQFINKKPVPFPPVTVTLSSTSIEA